MRLRPSRRPLRPAYCSSREAHLLNDWGIVEGRAEAVCWRPNRNAETFLIIFVRFLWTNRSGCFKLNWMSGKQTGINAVDQILQKVDLAGIQDERARE